ncbi:MAG TPA: AraC family transcriptional regulator [Polyangiaceae bacterium]|nr:AraC family transcriptional regulator [Polyangiaceae bacterium]
MGRLDQVRSVNAEGAKAAQTVSFQRRSDLAGVEIRSVENAQEEAFFYSPDFEFFVPITWRGEVWHRRRRIQLEPGSILIAQPGEAFLCRRAQEAGNHISLSVEAEVMARFAELCGVAMADFAFSADGLLSDALSRCLRALTDCFKSTAATEPVEVHLMEWLTLVFQQLRVGSAAPPAGASLERPPAERVRECLHEDLSATLDMSRVSRETGLSRFQALRAFKSWYGLPPCAYQLRVRLGLAQRLLRHGARPAAVAAEYGFVDQSHLTRHFRRWLGITPAEYARVGIEPSALRTNDLSLLAG